MVIRNLALAALAACAFVALPTVEAVASSGPGDVVQRASGKTSAAYDCKRRNNSYARWYCRIHMQHLSTTTTYTRTYTLRCTGSIPNSENAVRPSKIEYYLNQGDNDHFFCHLFGAESTREGYHCWYQRPGDARFDINIECNYK